MMSTGILDNNKLTPNMFRNMLVNIQGKRNYNDYEYPPLYVDINDIKMHINQGSKISSNSAINSEVICISDDDESPIGDASGEEYEDDLEVIIDYPPLDVLNASNKNSNEHTKQESYIIVEDSHESMDTEKILPLVTESHPNNNPQQCNDEVSREYESENDEPPLVIDEGSNCCNDLLCNSTKHKLSSLNQNETLQNENDDFVFEDKLNSDINNTKTETLQAIKTENENYQDEISEEPLDIEHDNDSEDIDIKVEYSSISMEDEPPSFSVNDLRLSEENSLVCNMCAFQTNDELCMKIHKKTHRFKYQCNSCSYICGSATKLGNHKKKKHMSLEELLYYCGDCSFSTLKLKDMKKHRGDLHPRTDRSDPKKIKQCPVCPYGHGLKQVVLNHLEESHDSTPFRCDTCNKLFLNKKNLVQHSKRHSCPVKEKAFRCKLCEHMDVSLGSLREHHRLKHSVNPGIRKKQCSECSFESASMRTVLRHLEMCHNISFRCGTCRAMFFSEKDVELHSKCHTYEVIDGFYKCKLCDYIGNNIAGIREHNKHDHSALGGKDVFTCDHCAYSTFRFSYLKNHMERYHTSMEAGPAGSESQT